MAVADANGRGAVVVTGASTGIGRATALHLDSIGFEIFAGVRKQTDGESVAAEGSDRLRSLLIDVIDAPSIEAAAKEVREAVGDRGLAGLVNNAGIAVAAPMEILPLDRLRQQLEVNVVGQVAVTQAFLPLLRAGKGRVVNMGSVGGRVSTPSVGPYSASKFALEAITNTMRRELRPWGIWVSVIEPGAIATPIWDKSAETADTVLAEIPPDKLALYEELIATTRTMAAKLGAGGLPPEKVADKVAHALTARRPRARYLIGAEAKTRVTLQHLLPTRTFDALVDRAMRG